MVIVAPSILSADFSCLGEDLSFLEGVPLARVHLDVMDGHFVPNISFGAVVFSSLRKMFFEQPFDAHLMLSSPRKHIESVVDAGADIISIHEEIEDDKLDLFNLIRGMGKRAGIAYSPNTELKSLETYLPYIDQVLIMSVSPGFSGQRFLENSLERIAYAQNLIKKKNLEGIVNIEVDGGINLETGLRCVEAGADVLVMGSALFSKSIPERLHLIKTLTSS